VEQETKIGLILSCILGRFLAVLRQENPPGSVVFWVGFWQFYARKTHQDLLCFWSVFGSFTPEKPTRICCVSARMSQPAFATAESVDA